MHTTPSEIVAKQVRAARRRRDLNRQQLAEKCRSIGAPKLTLAALTNIETGRPDSEGRRRREITVEELLALAYALDVNPVDLMVPGDAADDDPYDVTPEVTASSAATRDWISGLGFLTSKGAADLARALQWMPKERAEAVVARWVRRDGREQQAEQDVTVTLEDQVAVVAATNRITPEEARREVHRRAGIEDEGEKE